MRYFLENPPELPLCACLPDGARVAMSERCSWSKSGVLHTSALQNVHLLGSECALGGPGVNHHFVFATYSLSRLSRCVSGKRSWEVTKRLRCFWQQPGVFQRALSSLRVF